MIIGDDDFKIPTKNKTKLNNSSLEESKKNSNKFKDINKECINQKNTINDTI